MPTEKIFSGYVGCPYEEIRIKEITEDINIHTYTAMCRGKLFYCSIYHSSVLFLFPITTYSCARALSKDAKGND